MRFLIERPIRILIEIGKPAAAFARNGLNLSTSAREQAWTMLRDGRKNLAEATTGGNSFDIDRINQWLGGAIAMFAVLTGENAEQVLSDLRAEVPIGSNVPAPSNVKFFDVERPRPDPHPGAPKPLDLESLSDEEREELGIIMPPSEDAEETADRP
jgi:hypothetical protein